MKNSIISTFENRFLSQKVHPSFRPGDTIRVHYKIEELAKGTKKGESEKKFRIQPFEGVCIRFKKGVLNSTFTVRKIGANSVGVERVFPLHSPFVENIEIISGGKVRRSRLYYLRNLTGKAARIVSRRLDKGTAMSSVDASPASSTEENN